MDPLMLNLNSSYEDAVTKRIFCYASIHKNKKFENKTSFPCPFLTIDVRQDQVFNAELQQVEQNVEHLPTHTSHPGGGVSLHCPLYV